jgi:hypothetical protein
MDAYFEFVSRERTPYRLVFESDLVNDPAVRERLDRVEASVAAAIAPLMQANTEFTVDESRLLAAAMVGMAQQSARFWQAHGETIPRERAAGLVAALAFKGGQAAAADVRRGGRPVLARGPRPDATRTRALAAGSQPTG